MRYLAATELANGFFNRFLVIAVQRSKLLPLGGQLSGSDLEHVRDNVRTALRCSRRDAAVSFTSVARERWIAAYPELSAERPGMHGAATARAEAHTARLALIYALLDASEHIALEHLEAALAVWTYAQASSGWIFGESVGDPSADDIWTLAKDRPGGISRTEVRDLFSRNKKAREIDRALGALGDAGRLKRQAHTDGRGRAAEVWIPKVH
ncbi:MAG: hypothetical protein ACLP01_26230 [Solirubrobacteraceae bacterium]